MKGFLRSLLIAIAILLLLEVGSRIGWHMQNIWYIYSPDLNWEKRPDFSGEVFETKRTFDSQGFITVDSEQVSDTTKAKIIFIGDSNTFGIMVPTHLTFIELLDDLLPDYSVINMSIPGYTSYQGKILLKRALDIHPSIIFVSHNFNDRRYVLKKEFIDSKSRFQTLYKWSNIYLLRFASYIRRRVGFLKTKNVDINTLYARVPPDSFKQNLMDMAEVAKNRNATLVFLLLNDNPIQTEHLRRGIKFYENLQYDQAIKQFKKAIDADNSHSFLARKYLSRIYKEKGMIEEYERSLIFENALISLHGGHPMYTDFEYNEITKSVAKACNIKVIDGGCILDNDPSFYLDFCHFDERGHGEIANHLKRCVDEIVSQDECN